MVFIKKQTKRNQKTKNRTKQNEKQQQQKAKTDLQNDRLSGAEETNREMVLTLRHIRHSFLIQ